MELPPKPKDGVTSESWGVAAGSRDSAESESSLNGMLLLSPINLDTMHSSEIIRQSVDRFPDRPAVIAPNGEAYSYSQMDSRSTRIARVVTDMVGDGRTATLTNNVVPAVEMFVASQKRGISNVPLHGRTTVDTQAYMVERADVKLLLFEDTFEDEARKLLETTDVDRAIRIGEGETDVEHATVDSYKQALDREPNASIQRPAEAESGITFTSGTTGRPKGVVIDQERAYTASTETVMEFSITPQDVAAVITPFYHVVTPYTWVLPHFQVGACIALQPSFDPAGTIRLIEQHDVTTLMAVPAQLKALLEAQKETRANLSSLARLRTIGAITADTVEQVQEHLCDGFHITYGCTEAMGNVLHSYPAEQEQYPAVTGRPGLNWTVRVVEAAGPTEKPDPEATVEPGDRGEILAKGPTVVDGYIDRSRDTEDLFVDGWLRPGDIVQRHEAGHYTVVGRVDSMIVSGGENVYPQEVEKRLEEHPDVENVAVIGVPDETWGQAVKAVVVGDTTPEELDEFIESHQKLAGYKRPRYYEFTDELPRSSTGLRRERIRQEYS